MKYAILGGGGCFGLNFARWAILCGHEVIGAGRSALRCEAFTLGTDRMGYRYRVFNVGPDNEFLLEWLDNEKPDVIVNFAAQGEGAASYKSKHWKYFYRTNVDALVELTELLLERKWMKRFIHVGTSEVYGSVSAPASEISLLNPTSPYAASKLCFDQHLVSIAKTWGFPAIVVRPSNCMTPGQQVHRVVPKTFILAMTGRKLPLHGGGRAEKSYLAAHELSRAIILLAERGSVGEIYNAGPQMAVSIRGLVTMCAEALDKRLEDVAVDVDDRTGQDSRYWLDSSKLRALGWTPRTTLQQAIWEVKEWVRQHLDVLGKMPLDYEMRA